MRLCNSAPTLARNSCNVLATEETSLQTVSNSRLPDQKMNIWAETQILENKVMKLEGRRWEKKHFGNFETIYSVLLYKINSFHTTPSIFCKTVPTHTQI